MSQWKLPNYSHFGPIVKRAPDNSSQNKSTAPTADSQANAKVDRETTAKVRKVIVNDKDLSTYAHKREDHYGER
jgi:hypothetical protein